MSEQKNKEIYLTEEGLREIKDELNYLKAEKRPEVITAIKEARALGDLSENADYHVAREEQAILELRIQELEDIIENAIIIKNQKSNKVKIGTTVTIEYSGDDEIEEYKIVGSCEANPSQNKISNESPIAKAIIGHKKGDIVTVESPNGTYDVKILEIK
ncbi:MAG: transcription elongation factor GreA [Bacilli bacterium]|jgi:transcription elongation factor GreA|nr:transcription elongation factor GreA [Bacilli bacterium]